MVLEPSGMMQVNPEEGAEISRRKGMGDRMVPAPMMRYPEG